ncbi:xanthine dehydrogenase molybdopterin binding subunit [Iodidimonas nitroreducens]|uniref:Xanthine dehydrogenase molybdopterin binding subunit n=1 Tax=Iodidimonas nitroreducens TaxID=1236968 RepID=A0A5A7N6A9_9PROT|nr:xanthine dehydrogenase molybdopterin binding subunit [Iodidimonas nitroreducens]GAK34309.1 xanthine dehydrogenase/oxidase [alpha proteobacterium Q-1]GER03537.1 xanthine dehydrogenase molybdopterin binding subunit [Iodidimonas nitroreducens]
MTDVKMADVKTEKPKAPISGGVATAIAHDSAAKHVAGSARYVDDLPEPKGLLHLYALQSPHAHARITAMDLDAVRAAPGVAMVVTAADLPAANQIGAVFKDEPLLADGLVHYAGHPVAVVAANSIDQARHAASLAQISYEVLAPILTIADAHQAGSYLEPPQKMARGDASKALKAAAHRLQGQLAVNGQDHFYLEGQVALAIPGEDEDVHITSSTQHPSELQHLVAEVLGVANHAVSVEVRRMGGGFGGKESQPAIFAALAAVVAKHTGRPAKFRLDRDDDMVITGKRHEALITYDVGFDADGRIEGIAFEQFIRCGYAADLSLAVSDRAMFHADNAYFLPHVEITSFRCRTHSVSNTAFRGFGGPQGVIGIERVMDDIAAFLGKDPYAVRCLNLYGGAGRDLTPYHQQVTDNVIGQIMADLADETDYAARRAAVQAFNESHRWQKKGLALTPVKFGISFTATHLNQAGALVHLYADGSVHLNHGGTEMGQGLMTKVAQVVAEEFQIDLSRIKITATHTGKVPNSSATAASSGSDLNGMAAQAAARTIKNRLIDFACEKAGVGRDQVRFEANRVVIGNEEISFDALVREAYFARISLSSTGFYKTPDIHYDRAKHQGRPFYYYAYGAALSEVVIDVLTGESRVLAVDILHDVGRSLNPAVDKGQIEGGFIQGMGWLTTEELVFDADGRLRTHAPSTYKIPAASDRPDHFRISLFDNANKEATIHRSKAVGEPPFMLAISVHSALVDALASLADGPVRPCLDAPATPEAILQAIHQTGLGAVGMKAFAGSLDHG